MTEKSQRKEILPGDRLIFALDVPTLAEAERLTRLLRPEIRYFKIGLELFLAAGLDVIEVIAQTGAKIFLDLKLLDIPETVLRALKVIGRHRDRIVFVTLHPSTHGFSEAIRSEHFPGLSLLVVPVLTSMSDEDLAESGSTHTVQERVAFMTERSLKQGFQGVVASGMEARELRSQFGEDFLIVAPGIRPGWSSVDGDDQKRIVTPGEALLNGVDYIVVGRPIRNHPDNEGGPLEAARRIQREIGAALQKLQGAGTAPEQGARGTVPMER